MKKYHLRLVGAQFDYSFPRLDLEVRDSTDEVIADFKQGQTIGRIAMTPEDDDPKLLPFWVDSSQRLFMFSNSYIVETDNGAFKRATLLFSK